MVQIWNYSLVVVEVFKESILRNILRIKENFPYFEPKMGKITKQRYAPFNDCVLTVLQLYGKFLINPPKKFENGLTGSI